MTARIEIPAKHLPLGVATASFDPAQLRSYAEACNTGWRDLQIKPYVMLWLLDHAFLSFSEKRGRAERNHAWNLVIEELALQLERVAERLAEARLVSGEQMARDYRRAAVLVRRCVRAERDDPQAEAEASTTGDESTADTPPTAADHLANLERLVREKPACPVPTCMHEHCTKIREARATYERAIAAERQREDTERTPPAIAEPWDPMRLAPFDPEAIRAGIGPISVRPVNVTMKVSYPDRLPPEIRQDADRMKLQARNYMRRYAAYLHAEHRSVTAKEAAERGRRTGQWQLGGVEIFRVPPREPDPPGVARTIDWSRDSKHLISSPAKPQTGLPDAVRDAVEALVRDNARDVEKGCEHIGYGANGTDHTYTLLTDRGRLEAVERWYTMDIGPKIERQIEHEARARYMLAPLRALDAEPSPFLTRPATPEDLPRSEFVQDDGTLKVEAPDDQLFWSEAKAKAAETGCTVEWAHTVLTAQDREHRIGCTCDYEIRKAGRESMGFDPAEVVHAENCPARPQLRTPRDPATGGPDLG